MVRGAGHLLSMMVRNGTARKGVVGVQIRREWETLSESIILSAVYFYLLGNSVASQDVTIFQQ